MIGYSFSLRRWKSLGVPPTCCSQVLRERLVGELSKYCTRERDSQRWIATKVMSQRRSA